jgi:hypothetical protein
MAHRSWVFMVPVGELLLMEAVGREFRVDRAIFVHRDRLPRVRRRLGLGATVSKVKRTISDWDFFDSGTAFAVMQQAGEPEEVQHQCMKIIREELTILSLSQLGYSRRKQMGPVTPSRDITNSYLSFLAVSSRDSARFGKYSATAPSHQLVLDGRWKDYQDLMFFTKLLKILRRETKVETDWYWELRRASLMIGESVGANDLFKSFLWNMIALEMLLTKDEKGEMLDILPRRVGALLDWSPYWEADNYEERIRNAYKKRNALLHRGRRSKLSERDVAFTDHLLSNVLTNLVSFPKLFSSKEAFVKFSKKVEAEHMLGVKSTVRPQNLRFSRHHKPDF